MVPEESSVEVGMLVCWIATAVRKLVWGVLEGEKEMRRLVGEHKGTSLIGISGYCH